MKILTWEDFPNPCYNPQERYGDFKGTILDILKDERIPSEDKIWAATRPDILDDKTLRLFACKCVREVWHLLTDERSKNAVIVSEKFAIGKATKEELAAAMFAAMAAALDSAMAAARAAARAAAMDAARDAARAAAMDAARDAAMDAALDSAMAAARAAALDSAMAAARAAAMAAARAAAMDSQVEIIIQLINEYTKLNP